MTATKVYVSRIFGASCYNEDGDRVGKLRDLIVVERESRSPRIVGILIETSSRKRVFLGMPRVVSIGASSIIISGELSPKKFEQRLSETRLQTELLGRQVTFGADEAKGVIEDVSIVLQSNLDWLVDDVVFRLPKSRGVFGKGPTRLGKWTDILVSDDDTSSAASRFLSASSDLPATDLAHELRELPREQMLSIAQELADGRLADVLEEMPEDAQVDILARLDNDRAADVLDQMQPDDAADLIAQLDDERGEELLTLMEPEEQADVRRLLTYAPDTAGGLMTADGIIVSADTTVAEALALIRRSDIGAAMASSVFVTLPPYDTPTGRYLGTVHFQRMLRYPPHERIDGLIDQNSEPVPASASDAQVARMLASYDLVSLPVVDEARRMVGVITIDDVLDHLLPEDWRDADEEGPRPSRVAERAARRGDSTVRAGGRD